MTHLPKEVGKNIWTMDGPNIVFAGASMHTRTTIVKLADGNLWIHSPIEYSNEIAQTIVKLGGEVVALIAPNKFHYMFVDQWASAYPSAQVFAESSLMAKVSSLKDSTKLTNKAPSLYAVDIDQTIFAGNRMFQETVFFHKASKTLILTDLMINLRPKGIKLLPRLFLRFEGALFPNGGIPRLYRWFTRDKIRARESLEVIKSWAPERLVFCHGEPFTENAADTIETQFQWLNDA